MTTVLFVVGISRSQAKMAAHYTILFCI